MPKPRLYWVTRDAADRDHVDVWARRPVFAKGIYWDRENRKYLFTTTAHAFTRVFGLVPEPGGIWRVSFGKLIGAPVTRPGRVGGE